ncbi:UDP-N-acetylglucosamine 2-epimerase [Marinobacter goseongensis]|uniref:UDP-N-acetylglucosamine 2-epimerase n=1 Tax=Marinobacter goseongensis TaxID=453838 RepID=UPI002004AEB9|nr:UDP-N-acetylglucosamine 2-epimerase [Marinobacter goseongensis]
MTGHRRESFGEGFDSLCRSLRHIAREYQDLQIVFPVHFNPNVREPVQRILSGVERGFLIEPEEYLPLVYLMTSCNLIITDSGGIQEEAPSLGKSVLVTRETTERPEAVLAGTVTLVGTRSSKLIQEVGKFFADHDSQRRGVQISNPYGDGFASKRIVESFMSVFA